MLSREDLVKYPFTPDALQYLGVEELTIDDLVTQGVVTQRTIDAAIARIKEALDYGVVQTQGPDPNQEISSFLLSLLLVAAVEDTYLTKRLAVAEAERVNGALLNEPLDKIVDLGKSAFRLEIQPRREPQEGVEEASIEFFQYTLLAAEITEPTWKPVNRQTADGQVTLRKHELARLLAESLRRRLAITAKPPTTLPAEIVKAIQQVRSYVEPVKRRFRPAEEYRGPTVAEAFPPCMQVLLGELYAGKNLSHHGRFAVTTFLLRAGKSADEVVELFRRIPDFNERLTRYQTEHLAGQRGGRTKYTTPSCRTMKSLGLCINPDDLCAKIRHPLTYYNIKTRKKTRREPQTAQAS